MTEHQLELVPAAAPKLTDRQLAIVAALETAGHEGIDTEDAGAILHSLKEGRWAHPRTDRCAYCARDGKAYLERLRDLGLAKYRRARRDQPGAWISISAPETGVVSSAMLPDDQPIPY